MLAVYPAETLLPSDMTKIRIYWEDARAGIVRRDKQYDLITQSPLYLKQTGSSLLLSREYFALLKSRLKPGGIAGIYCNSQGNPAQAAMVRRTGVAYPVTASLCVILAARPAVAAGRLADEVAADGGSA